MSIRRLAGWRGVAAAAMAVGMLLTATSSVWAHDCYNASVSSTGAVQKTNSANWFVALDVRELVATGSSGFVNGADFGLTALDSCGQQAFLAYWATTGLPYVFTTAVQHIATGSGGVIADNNPNFTNQKLSGDGKGIEHFEMTGGQIIGSLFAGYAAAGVACG